MPQQTQKNFIKVFNHGTNAIILDSTDCTVIQARPTELHFKADGDMNNNPSFCLVMECPGTKIFGQFSLKTIQKALAELGYTLYQP